MKQTVCDLLLYRKESHRNENAIGSIENKNIVFQTFDGYHNIIESLSIGLLTLGLKQNDKVCILSQTRKEWHFLDFSILCSGGITVPIYPSYQSEDIEYIVDHCEASILIVEDEKQFEKLIPISKKLTQIKKIISIEPIPAELINKLELGITCLSYEELLNTGINELQTQPDLFRLTIQNVQPADIATIIYTSGTTGLPKGAVITHEGIYQMLSNVEKFIHKAIDKEDRLLTYLPLSHVLGRCESYLPLLFACETVYAESIEKLIQNISIVKPTLMTGVPRIFEKIYEGVLNKLDDGMLKKNIFEWAMTSANNYYDVIDNDRTPNTKTILEYQLSKKIIFQKIYNQFGGRIRYFISGGAPLSEEIIKFLRNCNLTVLEGYGLTETIAPCCLNPMNKQVPGTVGQPIGDVELKFAEDNEILIRSKAMFKEYYKNPEETAKTIDEDGWLHTGDIGHLNNHGFLKITDRKKDIIITSGGKNVAPQKLENLLKLSPYISQAIIIGNGKKYLSALIGIEKASFESFFEEFEISDDSELKVIANHGQVNQIIQNEINDLTKELASFESIKKFKILPIEINQDNYLTPSMKIKRASITKDFRSIIDAMY